MPGWKRGPKWANNGWVNGAVEVDGDGGHVVVDNKFELTTDTITVIALINGWKTVDWSGIVVGRSGTPFWMGVAANNTLTYVWNNNAGDTFGWAGAPEIPQDKWALVAIAIEPDKATAYVYHKATGKLDAKVNDIPHIEQTVMNLKFGWDECYGDRYFRGLIDEVMVYNRTLNADEIKRLATVGLPAISLSPALVSSPAVGQQLILSLNIVDGQKVAGYQASVEFDPTALRYVSSENGEYLRANAFVVPAVVTENTVTLAASSLVDETQGDGTLARLTFEVVAVKASAVRLSNVLLTDGSGRSTHPRIEHGQIIEPPVLAEDINGDGIVTIQDLVLVAANFGEAGENAADVNGDGVVNIVDLTLVVGALGQTAAAPALHASALETLSAADVRQWLRAAQQVNLTDPAFQRGVRFLEQLLAVLTLKETALLPNYPNPFNPETWIPYQLADPTEVKISIYAADGKLVRNLKFGHQNAGIYQTQSRAAYWDGRNELDEPVASGVYFYTLIAGDFTATRKMLIRK